MSVYEIKEFKIQLTGYDNIFKSLMLVSGGRGNSDVHTEMGMLHYTFMILLQKHYIFGSNFLRYLP